MTLRTRRILLVICAALFLIFSPIIILYSFGFRYDRDNRKIIQTGIIYIVAQPQDNIKVFIDGKEETERLSVKGILKKDYVIFNLLPRTYAVTIRRDGYSDWNKNLTVQQGIMTYAYPLLFPLNPADKPIFSDSNIIAWSISPDFNKIAYLKNKDGKIALAVDDISRKNTNLISLNDIGAKLDPVTDFSKELDLKAEISWAPNSRNFALTTQSKSSKIMFLASGDQSITFLNSSQTAGKMIQSEWNQENSSFLYLTNKRDLQLINPFSNGAKPLQIADNISGFNIQNNAVYYLDAKNLFIYRLSPSNPDSKQQVSFEPLKSYENSGNMDALAQNVRLIISNRSNIAIIAPSGDLFLIKQNGTPAYIASNIDSAEFSKDGDFLLYNSPFEITIYSVLDGKKSLVTRLAQKIGNVAWYKDYEHVWFAGDSILKNIELDTRPVPNIIDFKKLPKPYTKFIYDTTDDHAYYDQLDGNNLTIHQLDTGI